MEAVFDVKKLKAPLKSFLEENGLEPCEENQLVLKRTFSISGTNRQFVNGSPTTLNVLAKIGEWLVDIHGPHDHQSLLHSAKQLSILDAFGGLEKIREGFSEILRRRSAIENEKAALIVDERTYAQQLDLLRFQVKEIKSAQFRADEESEVEQEYQRASNAAKILELCQGAQGILSENESSLTTQAGALGRALQELQRVDPSAGCLLSLHEQAVQGLRDLQRDLSHYADKIEIDPARLQQVEERLNLIHSLKRKYGSSLVDVISFGEEAEGKLKALEQRDAELARLNGELEKIKGELKRAGEKLTAERRKIIPKLGKAAVKQLNDLGFKQSLFEVALKSGEEISSSGCDAVEFQFSPNPGEPLRPLRAIASSGEMARVMLALKTVLAAEDEVPVLIFDEVDANVGGETATAVGEKMKEIACQRQVLCVTHLPQVAASASTHFSVSKEMKAGRTVSEVRLLSAAERVAEMARMLGGQSAEALKHAKSLLKNAKSC